MKSCVEKGGEAEFFLRQAHERNLLQSEVKSSVDDPKIGTDEFGKL